MVEELSAALAEYLFLEIFDEAYHHSSCTVSEVFFFFFLSHVLTVLGHYSLKN